MLARITYALEELIRRTAVEGLETETTGQDDRSYELGRLRGRVQGLREALTVMTELIKDEEQKQDGSEQPPHFEG